MSDAIDKLVRQGSAKVLKKGPVSLAGQSGGRRTRISGVSLGHVLEVETCRGEVIRFDKKSSKPVLFWNPYQKYLGWILGLGKPSETGRFTDEMSRSAMPAKTVGLFKAFHGRDMKVGKFWDGVKTSDRWISIGAVCRVDYHSTKRGKRDSYTHDHGTGVKLYRLGTSKKSLWVIKGGSLTVTGRGIVN